MTDAGDIKRMTAIAADLRRWQVEVRLVPGWEQRGGTWSRVPVGVIDHHDASSIKSGEWGSLGYITANQLSQFEVGRGIGNVPRVAIVAAGICWHAGVGGWRFPDGLVVPKDSGNYWLYGVEKANDGLGEPYSEAATYAAEATFRSILERCG